MTRHITSAKTFEQAILKIIKSFKWLDKDGLIKDNVKLPNSKHTILFESNKGNLENLALININGRAKAITLDEAKNYLNEDHIQVLKYIKPKIFTNAYFEPVNKEYLNKLK